MEKNTTVWRKIEKQNNPKGMNLLQRKADVKTLKMMKQLKKDGCLMKSKNRGRKMYTKKDHITI